PPSRTLATRSSPATPATAPYALSLHDALPISGTVASSGSGAAGASIVLGSSIGRSSATTEPTPTITGTSTAKMIRSSTRYSFAHFWDAATFLYCDKHSQLEANLYLALDQVPYDCVVSIDHNSC